MPVKRVSAVILAAGKGSRMLSERPKALHQLAGKSMIQHILDTVAQLDVQRCYVVYGHGGAQLRHALHDQPLQWVLQHEQRGTGDALLSLLPFAVDDETLLILYGDTPMISAETARCLLEAKPESGISLLTAELEDPTGYGRIIRAQGRVCAIVEDLDAVASQREIYEVNSGILAVDTASLRRWLPRLEESNAAGEIYLTDIIALAHAEGCPIHTVSPKDPNEIKGVNNLLELSRLERYYQRSQSEKLLLAGVRLADPDRFELRGTLRHGKDVTIGTEVLIHGTVYLGHRVEIGNGVLLSNCTVGDDCQIKSYTIIDGSSVAARCTVGPFAHLRPGNEIKDGAKVGNFVEIKQTIFGRNSKAAHLSYIGDAKIGDQVNIGAGTIICNYNGAEKLSTTVGDQVFIGSGSQLVAPVTIASGATIGAGTTVTHDVAQDELVLSRVPQRHIKGWKRPKKK